MWRDLGPEASVELRLDAAEENLRQVRQHLSQFEQKASKSAERLTADFDRERRARACAVKAIGSQLEETAIGGWQLAFMESCGSLSVWSSPACPSSCWTCPGFVER